MKRFLLALSLLAALSSVPADPASAEHRFALIVQVSDFANAENIPVIKDHGDTAVDARRFAAVLKSRWGFSNPVVLPESEARKASVMKALDDIAAKAQAGDAIVFYFSGHGANSEAGFSLCPYDAIKASDEHDIKEQELKDWLNNRVKTNNVTIILDCCFSKLGANSARDTRFKSKFMGRHTTGNAPLPQQMDLPTNKCVVLSGATENGVALQIQLGSTDWIGLFTYKLWNILTLAPQDTTYRALMNSVRTTVTDWLHKEDPGRAYQQKPDLFGADSLVDRKLFSPPAEVPQPQAGIPQPADIVTPPLVPPSATITEDASAGKVHLINGLAAPAAAGSIYDVYAPDDRELKAPIGSIKVESTTNDGAVCTIEAGTDASKIVKGCHALAKTNYRPPVDPNEQKILVWIGGTPALVGQLTEALKNETKYARIVVDDKTPVNLALTVDADASGAKATMLQADRRSPLVDPNHPIVYSGDIAVIAGSVSKHVEQLMAMKIVTSLQNPRQDVRLVAKPQKDLCEEGKSNPIFVTVNKDCYVFIVDIDPNGTPTLLFPTRPGDDGKCAATATPVEFPRGMVDQFKAGPPFGNDNVYVIAITDQAKATTLLQLFNQAITDTSGTPAQYRSRAYTLTTNVTDLQHVDLGTWAIANAPSRTISKADAAGAGSAGTK